MKNSLLPDSWSTSLWIVPYNFAQHWQTTLQSSHTGRFHAENISWRTAKALFWNILWFSDNLWRRKNYFNVQIYVDEQKVNRKCINKSQFFPFEIKQTVDKVNLPEKWQKSNSFWKQKDRKWFGYFNFQRECHATSWVTGCQLKKKIFRIYHAGKINGKTHRGIILKEAHAFLLSSLLAPTLSLPSARLDMLYLL